MLGVMDIVSPDHTLEVGMLRFNLEGDTLVDQDVVEQEIENSVGGYSEANVAEEEQRGYFVAGYDQGNGGDTEYQGEQIVAL